MECKRLGCNNKALDWKVCAQCFKSRYCSEKCLEADWENGHEEQCEGHEFTLRDLIPQKNKFLKTLGKGSYSEVKLVQHRKTKTYYALKVIDKSIISVGLPLQTLFREISIHKSLNHDSIIKLYDQLEDRSNIYLVLEYANNCDLHEYIMQNQQLTEAESAKILVELCMGVKYMHDRGIIHRDLKAENVLLTDQNVCKICDLGWSVVCDGPRKTFCGTLDYMSPEILLGDNYSFPSDIWSLGVLLYEMLHGRPPYSQCIEGDMIERIQEQDLKIDPRLSPAAKNLLLKVLQFNPNKRASIADILKHRWVQENYLLEFDLEVGKMISHAELGIGTVLFSKGIMCNVEFPNGSKEFVIPELLKEAVIVSEDCDDDSVQMLGLKIGRSVSPIPKMRDNDRRKTWKLEDSYSACLSMEYSTMTGGDLQDICESGEGACTIADKQKELDQLQTVLEKNEKPTRERNRKRTSVIDMLLGNASCVNR